MERFNYYIVFTNDAGAICAADLWLEKEIETADDIAKLRQIIKDDSRQIATNPVIVSWKRIS